MKSLLLPLSFLACHSGWTVAAFQPPLPSFSSAAAARSSAIGARKTLSNIGEEDGPTSGVEEGRRRALESLLMGSAAVSLCWGTGGIEAARADLDMDAFVNSQVRDAVRGTESLLRAASAADRSIVRLIFPSFVRRLAAASLKAGDGGYHFLTLAAHSFLCLLSLLFPA